MSVYGLKLDQENGQQHYSEDSLIVSGSLLFRTFSEGNNKHDMALKCFGVELHSVCKTVSAQCPLLNSKIFQSRSDYTPRHHKKGMGGGGGGANLSTLPAAPSILVN